MELELDEQLSQARRIGLSNAHGVEFQRDRKILANGYQLLRKPREIALFHERFPRTLLRQAWRSGEDRFQITVLDHQVARCFLADSLDARHVVGAIADQGEV